MSMYSPYYNNTQVSVDRIDNQIKELEGMRAQIQRSTPAINQTFQLAPSNQGAIRYADNVSTVEGELVFGDTIFVSKDFSLMWLKNVKGEIKSYTLTEIIEKDEKDLMIESLQNQIDELKGMIKDEKHEPSDNVRETKGGKPSELPDGTTTNAE